MLYNYNVVLELLKFVGEHIYGNFDKNEMVK